MTYSSTIWRVLSVVAIPLAIFLMISLFSAVKERNEALNEASIVKAQYAALERSSAVQNAEIARLNAEAVAAKETYLKAKTVADKKNQQLSVQLSAIKKLKGSSCNDAMPFVDSIIAEVRG